MRIRWKNPRPKQPRRGLVAGVLATVLVALTAVAGPAVADSFDNQRHAAEARAAQAAQAAQAIAASIEDLSAQLGQAVLDLQATQARLPVAQAELATAQADLERSQRQAVLIAARLVDAQALEARITATIVTDDARVQEIRTAVGQLARRAYKGETAATSLSVVMGAKTAEDFVSQYGMIATALRTQTQALDQLQQSAAVNRNGQARLTAVKQKVAALKVEADQKVVEADAARAAAAARTAEIQQLIVDQAARQAAIAALKVQAEAEQAQIDAERSAIAAELADIIAKQRAAGAAKKPTGSVAGALFGNPTSFDPIGVTSEYGMRFHPILHIWRLHAGIDLHTFCNTPIYAGRPGTVQWARLLYGFGNQVMVDHGFVNGNSLMSSYNHMSSFVVSAGQQVSEGQLLGYSGDTGTSVACHLHFEVYVNGQTVNPRPLLGL